MNRAYVGQRVQTEHGPGTVEHVYHGTITMVEPTRRRFQMCTVLLDEPYRDTHEYLVRRIEAEVRFYRSRRYG